MEIKFHKNYVVKKSIFKEYEKLIFREYSWYEKVSNLGYKDIPSEITLDKNKLRMEKISGKVFLI